MTNLTKQIFSVIAAGALVVNTAGVAFADTTIQISGNGAGSTNFNTVSQTNTTSVQQNNTANVTNEVNSSAKTGGNDANFNTNGNTTVDTGAASTTTNVTNTLNSNAANVGCDTCSGGNTAVTTSGNGALSTNTVKLGLDNKTTVQQGNTANVTNDVNSNAKTGGNDANMNTGGNVTVKTGNATTNTTVSTVANSNVAQVGAGAGASATPTPTASFKIVGNGAGSNNYIDAGLSQSASVNQGNGAYVTNDVNSNAKTGRNDANFNTGGDVMLVTGAANATTNVDNMVNFNAATVDCGCGYGVTAKIAGNGAVPFFANGLNTITLGLNNSQVYGQGNNANLQNYDVNGNAYTGANDSNSNVGAVNLMNDPALVTGGATTNTTVSNNGNQNVIGGTLPSFQLGNTNVGFNFNWAAFLGYFGIQV